MGTKKALPRTVRHSRLEQARRHLKLSVNEFYRRAGSEEDPPISGQQTLTDATTAKRAIDGGTELYIQPYVHRLIDKTLGPRPSKSAQRRQERLERRQLRQLTAQRASQQQASA